MMLARLLAALLIGILVAPASAWADAGVRLVGAGKRATVSVADFVTREESVFGGSALNPTLARRVAPFTPLALPIAPTGWTTDSSLGDTCDSTTIDDVQALLDSICTPDSVENTVIDLPDCTATKTQTTPDTFHWAAIDIPADCDGIILQGDGVTELWLDGASGYPPDDSIPSEAMMISTHTSATDMSALTSCNLDAAALPDMGATLISIDSGCDMTTTTGTARWTPGSIIRLNATFADQEGQSVFEARILCADGRSGSGGEQVGTSCGQITTNNQIVIDRPVLFDYEGTGYPFAISAQAVDLMEIRGSGDNAIDTDRIPERIGIENTTFGNNAAYMQDARSPAIRVSHCVDCWVTGNKVKAWGSEVVGFRAGAARVLVAGNDFDSPVWRAECVTDLKAIGTGNPSLLTLDSTGGDLCNSADPSIFISTGAAEPSLRGKEFAITHVSDDGTDKIVSLTGINGAGFATGAGGWIAQQNPYNVASHYFYPSSEMHVINNSYKDPRVIALFQDGGTGHVIAYNYARSALTAHVSRYIFLHGNGHGMAILIEGNDFDGPIIPRANSVNAAGEGSLVTLAFNRLTNPGDGTAFDGRSDFSDQCNVGSPAHEGRGTFCLDEFSASGEGSADLWAWSYIGNSFYSMTGGTTANERLDWLKAGGTGNFDFLWIRNRATKSGYDIDGNLESSNATTDRDDAATDINEGATAVPSGWDTGLFASVLYDSTGAPPPFWCVESGTFRSIGSDVDDFGGSPSRLPADLRVNGETCTLP